MKFIQFIQDSETRSSLIKPMVTCANGDNGLCWFGHAGVAVGLDELGGGAADAVVVGRHQVAIDRRALKPKKFVTHFLGLLLFTKILSPPCWPGLCRFLVKDNCALFLCRLICIVIVCIGVKYDVKQYEKKSC
jgi:hypothetical protein